MRIEPVEPHIGFWAMHWPWWRVKLRAAYCHLPGAVRRALEPAARQLPPDEHRVAPPRWPDDEAPKHWVAPSQPETETPGLEWPSDQAPPPPRQIDVRQVEEPRPRESGQFFDFLI